MAVTIEARDTSVEDILAALSRAFDMDYQSSVDLDKRLYGTYVGPLSRVVTRVLQGYNFVLKIDNGSIFVTVVGTPSPRTRRRRDYPHRVPQGPRLVNRGGLEWLQYRGDSIPRQRLLLYQDRPRVCLRLL